MILVVAALTLSTMACDMNFYLPQTIKENGRVAEENRSIDSFSPSNFQGIGNLNVSYGKDESLTIEAEDNLLPYFVTYNQGERLVIEIEIENGKTTSPTEPVNFYLTITALESLEVSGLGKVDLPEIEADRFTIEISVAGEAEVDGLLIFRPTNLLNIRSLTDMTLKTSQPLSFTLFVRPILPTRWSKP